MPEPSVLDVALADSLHLVVEFQCERCGQRTARPAKHLHGLGCETLGDVRRRARCLVYSGNPKVRCNGMAKVWMAAAPDPDGYATKHVGDGWSLD